MSDQVSIVESESAAGPCRLPERAVCRVAARAGVDDTGKRLAREARLLRRRARQTAHKLREGLAQQLTGVSLMAKALELDLRDAGAEQTPVAETLSLLTVQAIHQCLHLADQIGGRLPSGLHRPLRPMRRVKL